MEQCCHQEPEQRPSFSEIKAMLAVKVPELVALSSHPMLDINPELNAAALVDLAREAADTRDLDRASQLFKRAALMGDRRHKSVLRGTTAIALVSLINLLSTPRSGMRGPHQMDMLMRKSGWQTGTWTASASL
ncbi:hypothetical protein M427DRAFT_267445 [Gonapodya prolifera JEL478]|uniref:Uncharacterized protein n=1 Tax=Gonapodya prolifera (strain JEL478) TaxID=1344416 RepID=A0A139AJC1_GONPJ|nr:hypothetical protein M427DRAFT_267445 [Gonapodya prolifera JEL478]|eukprot:KXS16900.1 hypothetical protein M427DRAFT_267445 [Gonapodya prolifera JEL478]